jgi:magnesium-transporting ATPase (P-type)
VEDKLQDAVPETVQYLLGAGMHVWILTGDKLETAVTIAFSSGIIKASMALAHVDGSDWASVRPQLDAAAALPALPGGKALVIGGAALALAREQGRGGLVELCRTCSVVVCARCAPVQKSEMVQLVMGELGRVSLAIGDGGNDVPMIKTAHVGVGIMGNEGMQVPPNPVPRPPARPGPQTTQMHACAAARAAAAADRRGSPGRGHLGRRARVRVTFRGPRPAVGAPSPWSRPDAGDVRVTWAQAASRLRVT